MKKEESNKEYWKDKYFWLHDYQLGKLDDILYKDLKQIVEKIEKLGTARISGFSTRMKSFESLWNKFKKNPKSPMMEESENPLTMEDLVGGKIIALNLCDLQMTKEIAEKSMQELGWAKKKEKDYVAEPLPSGHRAYHLYFKKAFFCKEFESFEAYSEIQILTESSDFWARWSHFLNYKGIEVEFPSRIEEKMFKTLSKRLEIIDEETNELRLELEYFRPAYPKKILGALPTAFDTKEKPQLRNISSLVPNLKWLAVYPNGLKAKDVFLGFDDKKDFGFTSENFSLSKTLAKKKYFEIADSIGMNELLRETSFEVLQNIYKEKKDESDKFFNGILARLEAYKTSANSLSLWFSKTSYWTLLLTNLALNTKLSKVGGVDCKKLTEQLWRFIDSDNTHKNICPQSILANNLAVHVTLETKDNQFIITQRGKMGTQSELWSNSASGDLSPQKWSKAKRGDLIPLTKKDRLELEREHISCKYVLSPFLGAQRELAEEIGVTVPMKDFLVQALVITAEHLQPILLMKAKTHLTFDEIIKSSPIARDRWELAKQNNGAGIKAIPATSEGLKQLKNGFANVPGIENNLDKWQEKAVAGILLAFLPDCWI